MTAGVDDECLRPPQHRFDLLEQDKPLLATRDPARRGRVQDKERALDPPPSRPGSVPGAPRVRPIERRARRLRPEAACCAIPATTSSLYNLVDAGSLRARGSSSASVPLRLLEAPDHEEGGGTRDTAHTRHSPGRRALPAWPPRVERLRRQHQVAGDERHLRPRRRHTRARATASFRAVCTARQRRRRALGSERDRRAAAIGDASKARAPARRRAGHRASLRRGDRPRRRRAPRP
jgi:hypothetical protein